jgi:hypothetical protein
MSKLSKQARQDILDLTGAALTGILADHCHVRQIEGLSCGQSVAEWAATIAVETYHRLQEKLKCYPEVADTPVKGSIKQLTKEHKLYPPTAGL